MNDNPDMNPSNEPMPSPAAEAPSSDAPISTDAVAEETTEKLQEDIDLNHLFPGEDTDLNTLFPETDLRTLLKKVQRNKKDLSRMKDRFEAAGEEIEERLEDSFSPEEEDAPQEAE